MSSHSSRRVFRAAIVLGAGIMLPAVANAGEIPFDRRVEAQRAIEQVYWSHRVWPAENHGAKPALEEVLGEQALRAKVAAFPQSTKDVTSDSTAAVP